MPILLSMPDPAERASSKSPRPRNVVTYPRDAVLTVDQMALALNVSPRQVERMNVPYFLVGRSRRYVWGQVLDELQKQAVAP